MAVRNDGQAKAFEYMQLLQSGVSPADAYKKVYPNGIPTAAQQQQQAAKDRQSSALAGTGGTLAGVLGVKYGSKYGSELYDKFLGAGNSATTTSPAPNYTPGAPGSAASQVEFNAAADSATNAVQGPPKPLPEGATPNPDGSVTSADGSTIGTWAQGAGGALLFYQGYRQYQSGDKIGGSLGMGAGAAMGAQAAGASLGSAVPVLGGAYGAYTLGNMAANSGDMHKSDTGSATLQGASAGASLGAAIGSFVPGLGTAIGGAIGGTLGGLYGLGSGLSASSKGGRQVIRDSYRKNIINSGSPLFDANYKGTLADGSVFDFGKDKFGFGKKEGDFDLDNPTTAKAAAYGNVLAAMQGASGKGREAIATQFLGASTSNAQGDLNNVKNNYAHFLRQLGVKDLASAQAALDQARPSMSDNEYQVFSNDLKELFTPAPAKQQQNANAPKAQVVARPVSDAMAKKQLAQTGEFGNKLFKVLNG